MNRKFLVVLIGASVGALAFFGIGCEMCCNSSQGAGSIVITDPVSNASHRATFNYRVECIGSYADNTEANAARKVSGRLQYQDHGLWTNDSGTQLKVSIEAAIDNVVNTREAYVTAEGMRPPSTSDPYYDFLSIPTPKTAEAEVFCSDSYQKIAMFRGRYKPRVDSLGEGGTATVMVMDNGKGGPSSDDRFEIRLTGGVFDGYRQRGVLAGGNLRAQ